MPFRPTDAMLPDAMNLPSINLPPSFSSAKDGMQRGLNLVARASQSIAQEGMGPQNAADLIEGQRTVEMNAKAMQTADEVLGTILNVRA